MDPLLTMLDQLTATVCQSSKYRHVSPDLVQRIGARELEIRRSFKEAVKATKNKLHQVGGAYFETRINYKKALVQLDAAAGDAAAFRAVCRKLMGLHASTRERLPILDDFYATVLAGLAPRTILDVACGLNPLALPWMSLAAEAEYFACDIYADMVRFVNEFMSITGVRGAAEWRDVISDPPAQPVDLALLLKLLPVLAQVEPAAVSHLLDALNARYLLISFPVASLSGRSKGMVANYEEQFHSWAAGRSWRIQRFSFATELAFLVECDAA